MKLIIAGTRTIEKSAYQIQGAMSLFHIFPTEIVSGGASGIDQAGEAYAELHGRPIKRFLADWAKHGRSAGPIRNKEMAEYADALLLIWNGESNGSRNMKANMDGRNKPIYEVIIRA